ncbi:hypothetical protein [Synechococcus sp. M16CYN]|uniref:hypothetical protein n=1 Tax=Synechococcus sp. M16CYN TaxID=3103139 RepID=UPI00333F565A
MILNLTSRRSHQARTDPITTLPRREEASMKTYLYTIADTYHIGFQSFRQFFRRQGS